MALTLPTLVELDEICDKLRISLSSEDLVAYQGMMQGYVDAYNTVDAIPGKKPETYYPRGGWHRPAAEENKFNEWYVRCAIDGEADGPLKGWDIAVKDNVMVAGIPMMNGASTMEGYTPNVDATVVTRLLKSGARVVGKANCEYFCLSGGSHTCANGPVRNPINPERMAGGSSSGSAVAVATGECRGALGGDQGGSIRMPASFCGIVGMKPTFGLVPYTGIMPIEITVDHVGPMTRTVADNAKMLKALAGKDGFDPRQVYADEQVQDYEALLDKGVAGLRIGILQEGFGWAESDSKVDARVMAAARKLAELGAEVSQVSVPLHKLGSTLWAPVGIQGLYATMLVGDGYGISREDYYATDLMKFHARWRDQADEMSATTKLLMLFGEYVNARHGSYHYGKAINAVKTLRAAYDEALAQFDMLLMPTTPMTATEFPADDDVSQVKGAFEMLANTSPFDLTHHPAIAMPCGDVDGLPASLMLVGRHFDEARLYQAAAALEASL